VNRTKAKSAAASKTYSWIPGSRFGKNLNPTLIGAELEKLIASNHQKLVAENVVETAKNPANPLHPVFEWDDTKAAIAHRISQAQHLLRSVQVTIVTNKGQEITTRMTVTTERHKQPGKHYYSTTEYALSNEELRAQVLRQALLELAAFRRRYAELSELAQVFRVIQKLTSQAA
jgi:putative cell wall-binding protein